MREISECVCVFLRKRRECREREERNVRDIEERERWQMEMKGNKRNRTK